MHTPNISRATKMILTAEFILLAYMLYVLSTSLYKSYQVDRFIQNAADENAKLAVSNSSLAEDFEYYRSDAYREKIAKQNFGLVQPGEEVIILSKSDQPSLSSGEHAARVSNQYYNSLSNPKKWFMFFFDRERFSF